MQDLGRSSRRTFGGAAQGAAANGVAGAGVARSTDAQPVSASCSLAVCANRDISSAIGDKGEPMLFISHRESEQDLARALIELLISSLEIPEGKIRCTSVPGYQLPFGRSIPDQLKADINESDAVFALLTPSCLQSKWVLFELGASWALGTMVVPILAPDLTEKELPGPLTAYPIIKIGARDAGSRLRDAIGQISAKTGFKEKSGGGAQDSLERFVNGFRDWKSVTPPSLEQARAFQLSWLLVAVASDLVDYPPAALAEIEMLVGYLGLTLPPSWQDALRTDDGGHALQGLVARLGGQLRTVRPKILGYYEGGFNLLVSASHGNSLDFDRALAKLELPEDVKTGNGDFLERVNRIHSYFESILLSQ